MLESLKKEILTKHLWNCPGIKKHNLKTHLKQTWARREHACQLWLEKPHPGHKCAYNIDILYNDEHAQLFSNSNEQEYQYNLDSNKEYLQRRI